MKFDISSIDGKFDTRFGNYEITGESDLYIYDRVSGGSIGKFFCKDHVGRLINSKETPDDYEKQSLVLKAAAIDICGKPYLKQK